MLAPPEGLCAPGVPGVNPGGRPRGQGVIPRRFKRKKIFVTNVVVGVGGGWTHRREGGNSGLDINLFYITYAMYVKSCMGRTVRRYVLIRESLLVW